MKRLILVRHGKSSWKHDVPDHKRPHKKRASKDAGLVIHALKQHLEHPVTIWSSFAVRALETAKMFKKELQVEDKDFEVKDDLYTFDNDQLLSSIKTCDDSVEELMVFGHNPAITEVVNLLGDQYFDNIPTTGLCLIEFPGNSWNDIQSGKTILYLFPKNLR